MSVWIIQQQLNAEEQSRIWERACVSLPLDDMPDLSKVTERSHLLHLLQGIYQDKPPEALQFQLDRIWVRFSGLQADDTVAVPLPALGKVALGRVSGRYYHDGALHSIPIEWYRLLVPMTAFGKHKDLFAGSSMLEVADKEARIKILSKLPHKYNRFARWKWVLIVLIILQASSMLISALNR